ncbi:ecdysone oxidase-like [Anticarsia gemmatalis]|uniref:ecdysone oxidase-like n=1 Tax=Anticarsia gemmatalis TaxID=129554 RepID=UPI003F7675E5
MEVRLFLALLCIVGTNALVTYPSQADLEDNASYDYIVVGGGTAGCVVATRLAEEGDCTVMMLEAGGDPPANALLAGTFSTLPKLPSDYDYQSIYNPYSAGSQGNYSTLTSGKMLGGSASMNHFIHTRGCPEDFDNWAEISGETCWKYDNVLSYFMKSETLNDKEILAKYPQYHGTEGPMGISRQTSRKTKKYLESFNEVGYATVLDLNAADTPKGYTQTQYMLANKLRQTPAVSYLSRVKHNSNFFVSKNTKGVKIIFNGTTAIGVEAVYRGKTYQLYANKEVIISAGVFNTPQLLMLSGIGPKDHLTSLGIDCLLDLPVGDGYTDQAAVMLVYKTVKYFLPVPNPLDLISDPTKIPFPVIVGAVALNNSQTCADYQDFNLLLPHDTPQLLAACRQTFWYRTDICAKLELEAAARDIMFTLLVNLIPKSKGSIRLESSDPFGNLLIDTGFLKEEEDLKNMVAFVKNHIRILKTKFFLKNDADLLDLDLYECKDKEQYSQDFWECFVRNRVVSPFHYTSTCEMGKVVDGRLKVKGCENLRVVDASVIPSTPKAAPNAAVIMLAELGADFIKGKGSC